MWFTYEQLETSIIFLGFFFMAYVYYKRSQPLDYGESRPPSLLSFPIIGSFPILPRPQNLHFWFMEKMQTMGAVIGFSAGSQFAVVIQKREALNEAFIKQSSDFGSRSVLFVNHFMNPRLCGIVDRPLNESFKKYHRLTLTILRTFGFGDRGVMETRINSEVADLVAEFERHQTAPICPKAAVNSSVVNVIASILFGRRFDRNDPALADMISYINNFMIAAVEAIPINLFPVMRYFPPMRRRLDRVVEIHSRLIDFLQCKIDEVLNGDDTNDEPSFIKSFVDAEGRSDFDRDELLFILRDMIVAGSETSATTIMWAIALLADHRDVQARMREEIESVVGNVSATEEKENGTNVSQQLPSLTDRNNMPYVEAVILELMRFKTIIPMGVPRETIKNTEVDCYAIPTGTMVLPNLYAMHMDPAVWDDPTAFKPERFLDKTGNVIGREKVIPFSIGKRSCLGELLARQEIFLFVTGLVSNFEILPPQGQQFLNCSEAVGITVAPSPFTVRFVSRKKYL